MRKARQNHELQPNPTQPCKDCPFTDEEKLFLSQERRQEIGGYASDNARIYAPGQIMMNSRLTAYETYINYKAQLESTESRNGKVERIRTFDWTRASDERIDAVCDLLDEVKP